MIGRQIEEKEGNGCGRKLFSQGKRVICPVCGKEIHEVNLPDVKSIVEDNLPWGGLVLVDSSACFLINCEHRYEDAEKTWITRMNLLQLLCANLTVKVHAFTLR